MIYCDDEARARWTWSPLFTPREFECKHCHKLLVDTELMERLYRVRVRYGRPIRVNSGYRCPTYNQQVSSTGPNGPHTMGAVDVQCSGYEAHELLGLALEAEFRGVGVSQKGGHDGRFLHLDMVRTAVHPRPWVWSY